MSTRRYPRETADSPPANPCPSHSAPREVTPNRGDNVAALGRASFKGLGGTAAAPFRGQRRVWRAFRISLRIVSPKSRERALLRGFAIHVLILLTIRKTGRLEWVTFEPPSY
jgi:hypothetical protein